MWAQAQQEPGQALWGWMETLALDSATPLHSTLARLGSQCLMHSRYIHTRWRSLLHSSLVRPFFCLAHSALTTRHKQTHHCQRATCWHKTPCQPLIHAQQHFHSIASYALIEGCAGRQHANTLLQATDVPCCHSSRQTLRGP